MPGATVVRSVADGLPVDTRVGATVPDDTVGKPVADVSVAEVSPTDVVGASVGVGLT